MFHCRMSSNLKREFSKLQIVSNIKNKKLRKLFLKEFSKSDSFCKAYREIAKNAVKKNIQFTNSQKKKLKRHQSEIINLTHKGLSKKKKRQLFVNAVLVSCLLLFLLSLN